MERFSNHVMLRGKNVGGAGKLLGRVLLVVFLVDDAKTKWTDAAVTKYKKVIERTCFRLMKDSGRPLSQLSITYVNLRGSVPYEVTRHNCERVMRDVLREYYCDDAESFQELYKKEMDKDEICVSFVLNRVCTSYAQKIITLGGVPAVTDSKGNELSVVSFRKNDLVRSERSLTHELLHQFGAADYYTHPIAEQAANDYLPDSIMNDGWGIDPLTRYIIGWDDTLSPEAVAFLKATAFLTSKDV